MARSPLVFERFGLPKILKHLNWVFLSLILFLFLANYQMWGSAFWPTHDALRSFQYFYSFYNEFYLHGELPRWFPYGVYGLSVDDTQVFHLTPTYYFFIAIGSILRIQNTLIVFKMCLFFELFLLLIGTYFLASEFFKRKSVIFFVTAGVIGSAVWINKYIWNFKISYLLPFALYFLTLFFKKKRPHYFWITGIVCTAYLIGNLPYYAPLYIFTLLLFSAGWFLKQNPLSYFSEKSKSHFLSFFIFLIMAGVYIYFASHMFDHIESQLVRRGAGRGSSLNVFLTYEGRTGFQKLAALFYPIQTDTFTLYIGFLPLLFILYAILRVRSREFVIVGVTTFFLFAFSFSATSLVARLAYYVIPGMKFFRYVGHICALQRIFLMLLAGFGLEQFLNDREADKKSLAFQYTTRSAFLYGCLIALIAFILLVKGPVISDLVKEWNPVWTQFLIFALLNFFVCVLLLFGRAREQKNTYTMGIITIFFLIDLLSYQNMVMAGVPRQVDINPVVERIHSYQFEKNRSFELWDEREKAAFDVANKGTDPYSVATHNFILADACVPKHWVAHWSSYFIELFRIRGGILPETAAQPMVFKGDMEQFARALGCNTTKLGLMGKVTIARDQREAQILTMEAKDLNEEVALYGVPENVSAKWVPASSNQDLGELQVISFSFNRLMAEVNVKRAGGAWLYYRDSFHPGWKAWVDGRPVSIAVANLGFKAVFVGHGVHHVEFRYFDGLRGVASYLMAIFGICFCAAVLVYSLPKLIVQK